MTTSTDWKTVSSMELRHPRRLEITQSIFNSIKLPKKPSLLRHPACVSWKPNPDHHATRLYRKWVPSLGQKMQPSLQCNLLTTKSLRAACLRPTAADTDFHSLAAIRYATLHKRHVYRRPQLFLGIVDDRMPPAPPPLPPPTLSRAPRIAHAFFSGQEVMFALRKPPNSAMRSDEFKSLRPMSDPAVDS